MNVTMLNVHSFSIDPITWTTIISINFMYFKRLRLRTTNVGILQQSLIRGLRWFFSCNVISELCSMVILR
jgi:hypothetical protein